MLRRSSRAPHGAGEVFARIEGALGHVGCGAALSRSAPPASMPPNLRMRRASSVRVAAAPPSALGEWWGLEERWADVLVDTRGGQLDERLWPARVAARGEWLRMSWRARERPVRHIPACNISRVVVPRHARAGVSSQGVFHRQVTVRSLIGLPRSPLRSSFLHARTLKAGAPSKSVAEWVARCHAPASSGGG
jgi:hypothetical protein